MAVVTANADKYDEKNMHYDDLSSSIIEFLKKESDCTLPDDSSEVDVESLFEEINRLSGNTDDKSLEEILQEAEVLINKQNLLSERSDCGNVFKKTLQAVKSDSILSEESNPSGMKDSTENGDPKTNHQINKITENLEVVSISSTDCAKILQSTDSTESNNAENYNQSSGKTLNLAYNEKKLLTEKCKAKVNLTNKVSCNHDDLQVEHSRSVRKSSSNDNVSVKKSMEMKPCAGHEESINTLNSDKDKFKQNPVEFFTFLDRDTPGRSSICVRYLENDKVEAQSSNADHSTKNANAVSRSQPEYSPVSSEEFARSNSSQSTCASKNCDKSPKSSPIRVVHANTSPIESISLTREHILKHEIEQLQEKLKDTEERLQSLRIQHHSLSQVHRDIRESHTHLQEESELLKLDVQHLTECANILRSELHSARNDRNEAFQLQKVLESDLEESRNEKKKAQEQSEKYAKTIQDLHRQCREMERILMRKHPDSVSSLIVASKKTTNTSEDNAASRRLLEQRIAQLEADAKEQDAKAQKILANVQARFNSVQAKYETHISDLETQVLSLQEINTQLNEKIESQMLVLNNFSQTKQSCVNHYTQTDDIAERETVPMNSASTQTESLSRPNSSLKKIPPVKKSTTKMPSSHSDSTISSYHTTAKEDAHLLATIRGMRVDLAIKDKALQRLTRELEECKKTLKKLQKERETTKPDKFSNVASLNSRKMYDPSHYADFQSDNHALKEAMNKIKLMEFDYKALHDKRLQDLKTLQAAHERELASCHETVRILQQRLAERDEAFNNQKRRKVPIDYYALKAKVSSLERRHSEREQRLHMLVEALSKGRLNGEILTDKMNSE